MGTEILRAASVFWNDVVVVMNESGAVVAIDFETMSRAIFGGFF